MVIRVTIATAITLVRRREGQQFVKKITIKLSMVEISQGLLNIASRKMIIIIGTPTFWQ
jgi:hypothetical protein